MVLGATTRSVLHLIVKQALRPALIGVVAGLAAPFVMLSMPHDSALLILTEPVAALDLLDLR